MNADDNLDGSSQSSEKKSGRFKKGHSGNPRGRPPKRLTLLVPNEPEKLLVAILDEKMSAPPPKVEGMTKLEALLRSLVSSAARGQPTSLSHVMRLLPVALQKRFDAHMSVTIADMMRSELDKPIVDQDVRHLRRQAKTHIEAVRFKY